ncbi:MAG: ABC transporter ATP-binding protein [Clostridia bacterium]|nr:ABC transporter ATP-binding protein [Clostridia bacterium]
MIEIEHVSKYYGKNPVLRDVSLELGAGRIHGIIGRNGSGKTVLLKCVCGIVPVSEGRIVVDGKEIGRDLEMPQSVGLIIENPGFLPNCSGWRNLQYLADVRGRIDGGRIRKAMERVGLDPDSRKWVSRYSLGMRQRLGLAQALMENPKLLILDEPMNGLDNAGVRQVRRILRSLRDGGRTILLASHSTEDISSLCDTVTRLEAGRVVSHDC